MFPGQGLQYAGMGQSLVQNSEAACELAKLIGRALLDDGYPSDVVADMCTDEVDDPLRTQIVVYTHAVLAWCAFEEELRSRGVSTDLVATAGHSVGELAALVAGGAADPVTMARVVNTRARLMDEAPPGALVNVEQPLVDVEALLDTFHSSAPGHRVYVALIQGASLTAVGGLTDAIDAFGAFLTGREVEYRRVVGVGKPLHTPEQRKQRQRFRAELTRFAFGSMRARVMSNTRGVPYAQDKIADTLASQLDSPVRFADVVAHVKERNPDRYLLFGPADKLAELMAGYNGVDWRRIRIVNTAADLQEVVDELRTLSAGGTPRWLRMDLEDAVHEALKEKGERSHVVIDTLGRVRSVADMLQDRSGIVICKGSFNPVHNLHVALLRAARNERRSSLAVFALSAHTYKGELDHVELARRIRLIHLAGFPILLSRTGFFYENFEYFRDYAPDQEVAFALGSDVLTRLLDYFDASNELNFEKRLGGARFLCMVRGDATALKARVAGRRECSGVSYLDLQPTDGVSSSRIRSLRRAGDFDEIRRLMPARAAEAYLKISASS